jgi:alanyl-tRNA synthetase
MNHIELQKPTSKQIRQTFIDFFKQKADHTFVRSSSLVPGGDSTLLFTNAGMVQFKDIFLGTNQPAYTRAVNSQKCLRVAGKHNDLEDVGQDDTHHTFFEMLGNWSFGDYYKKEAIAWAWELLTEVWEIPKEHLYATVFLDELGEIPTDEEAAEIWRDQPGFNPDHLFYLGRKDNFWEMADTGPSGPCSEIHIDLNPGSGPVTQDTLETDRFIELWNLVFIQYNRISSTELIPLPATHIDTGMGFERIVNIIQEAGSNYKTDLFWPLIQATQGVTEQSEAEVEENFTSYRVIADHARAAAFLIADGVIPGNMGRNYICRMIIRRAFRFAGKIGINDPFLARIALTVIDLYGDIYPELVLHKENILDNITREEIQFQRSLEKGTVRVEDSLRSEEMVGKIIMSGEMAADLFYTTGMPLEITRDILKEHGLTVDEVGFRKAMEDHRMASGAGKAIGTHGGENVELYRQLRNKLQTQGSLPQSGVAYEPYGVKRELVFDSEILAIINKNQSVETAGPGETVEIILPSTKFYIESGGQVSDTGIITSHISPQEAYLKESWDQNLGDDDLMITISGVLRSAAGIITHNGKIVRGRINVGDRIVARVDIQRRLDIMRNHTATHLLHSALHNVLGKHARQAGSLVAPDRLRFDFNHPKALTDDELERIEETVNQKILGNYKLVITEKSIEDALKGGAIAIFGEKYEDVVRNIIVGDEVPFSNELCGGTHVKNTGNISTFIITSEGSTAAGIRRIEAITGREAYRLIKERSQHISTVAKILDTTPDRMVEKAESVITENKEMRKQIAEYREISTMQHFNRVLDETTISHGVNLLTAKLEDADVDSLRQMADRFRNLHPKKGVAVLASVIENRPIIITAVTQDLVPHGIKAGNLAGFVARQLGGGGGGKPTIAQAGGKDPSKIEAALASVSVWIKENLNN